jgi:hypothetical protein
VVVAGCLQRAGGDASAERLDVLGGLEDDVAGRVRAVKDELVALVDADRLDVDVRLGVWIVHRSHRAWRRDAEAHPQVGLEEALRDVRSP